MKEESRWVALVDDIYAAGLGEASWDKVLEGLRQITRSRMVGLIRVGEVEGAEVLSQMSDDAAWAEEFAGSYNTVFNRHDHTTEIVRDWEPGRWFDYREWCSPSQRARTLIHQEFFRPRGVDYFEGTFLHRSKDMAHYLTLVRSDEGDGDSPSCREQILGVHKHLNRAVRLRSQFAGLNEKVAQGEAVLEALDLPVFLLDERRRLLQTNAAARALMAREPGLRFVHDCFMPEGVSEPAAWQAACKLGMLAVPSRTEPHRPLTLTLAPVPASTRLAADWQRPLTLMTASGKRATPSRRDHLCAICGLTAAEADICMMLCQEGRSPKECADLRQVAIGTIRSQIKTILVKTGARRLPELVRLVACL